MIDQAYARSLVEQFLRDSEQFAQVELSILDEFTREYPYGWVFFYQDTRFIETGDPRFMVGGNAPVLVDKKTGALHVLSTSDRLERSLEAHARAWNEAPIDQTCESTTSRG
jgi:hypothetical protein